MPEQQGLSSLYNERRSNDSSSNAKSISIPDPAFMISLREPHMKKRKKKDVWTGIPSNNGGKVTTNPSYILKLRRKPTAKKETGEGLYTYNLDDNVGVEEWSRTLKEQLSPTTHVIVLILGYNNHADKVVTRYLAFQDGIQEASKRSGNEAHQQKQHHNHVVTVCFDWPAREAVRYVADRRTARKSAKLLFSSCINVLQQLAIGIIPPEQIHILTFSMGGFLLQKALREKKSDESANEIDNEPSKIGHVLISQADVARRDFGFKSRSRNKWICKKTSSTSTATSASTKMECFMSWIDKGITIYWSAEDLPLRLMSTMRLHARLGSKGLPVTVSKNMFGSSSSTTSAFSSSSKSTNLVISTPSINNVNCTSYFRETYGRYQKRLDLRSFVDSHEWPFLGRIPTKDGNGRYVGDSAFLTDVLQVITDTKKTQRHQVAEGVPKQPQEEHQQRHEYDSNNGSVVHHSNLIPNVQGINVNDAS